MRGTVATETAVGAQEFFSDFFGFLGRAEWVLWDRLSGVFDGAVSGPAVNRDDAIAAIPAGLTTVWECPFTFTVDGVSCLVTGL